MQIVVISTVAATCLALISLGGGLYEFSVVDPFWPKRPDLIQTSRGGISRKRFWIPAHCAFEVSLICALVAGWPLTDVRYCLWVGLLTHAVMRIWSAFDFIPKALAFERAEPGEITAASARRWSRRSLLRLPLDLITCAAMLMAFARLI